jgi:small subunit ribosomal protein S8e
MIRKRKVTGKKYIKKRKKKKYETPGQRTISKLGNEEKRKTKRTRGNNKKVVLIKSKFINVKMPDKKIKKTIINNVIETPSNKFLTRQNILTKGTILKTEIGNVKITNRPTQEGHLNGILIE